MRTIISPQNNIIVKLEKKFEEMIRCDNGVLLYKDVTFHPEEHVVLEAQVVSVPRSIIRRADYEAYTELPAIGDTVLIRYDVVFDYLDQPDNANPIYRNCIDLDGEEYWKVDVMQLFAVKQPKSYRMLNGHVMCDTIVESLDSISTLILPDYVKRRTRKDKLRIRHVGSGPYRKDHILYCRAGAVQEYRTYDDSFCIIQQRHIQGIAL